MPDVGPEFLDDVVEGGGFHLVFPIAQGLMPTSLLRRVVKIGQRSFAGIASDLGLIEASSSGIGFGENGARERVADAVEKSALAERVIARIFTGDDGNEGLREICSRDAVGEGTPVIASVSCGPTRRERQASWQSISGRATASERADVFPLW